MSSRRRWEDSGGAGEEVCEAWEEYRRVGERRVVDARVVVLAGREEEMQRRRLCCDEVEVCISLRAILDRLAVLCAQLVPELMRSMHRVAEVAVRFIIALLLCSVFYSPGLSVRLYCSLYRSIVQTSSNIIDR